MKKSIFSKFVSVAAAVAISVFLLAGCAEDPANNNGGGNGGSNQQSGGDGDSSNSNQNSNNNSGGNSKVPARVTAVGSSSRSITISWSAVPDANGYYIYRNDQESGPYTQANSTYGTSWTDNGLADYTTYYYKVASYTYSGGEREQSAPVSATTFLVAPSGVKAKSETSSSITISWNNLQYATDYRIFKRSNDGTYTEVGTSASNSYTDTGLPTNTQYSYKVSGYNSITEGDESSSVSATTILKAPARVTAEGSSSKSIIISWSAVPDANGYYIYRSDQESGPYTQANSTYGTSWTNSGLADNTTYYYKVAAYTYSGGEGELSSPVSATTL